MAQPLKVLLIMKKSRIIINMRKIWTISSAGSKAKWRPQKHFCTFDIDSRPTGSSRIE